MTKFLGQGADWALNLLDDIGVFLVIVLALVGAVVVGYSIYLGFQLAKADDEGKRQKAKKRIIATLAGLFIIVILSTTLFNPVFYEAIFRNTTDRGNRITLSGVPMNSLNQYEFAVGTTTSLRTDYGWNLNFEKMEVKVIQPDASGNASLRKLLGTTSMQAQASVANTTLSNVAVVEFDKARRLLVTGVAAGDAQLLFTLFPQEGSPQNFRFPITVLSNTEWANKYPYAVRFHANEGLFAGAASPAETEVLFGLSDNHRFTNEELMNIGSGTNVHNNEKRISKTWFDRIGWTSSGLESVGVNVQAPPSSQFSLVNNTSVKSLLEDGRVNRTTDANGITIFDIHAFWRDIRIPEFGFTDPSIFPPPPPPPPIETPPPYTPPRQPSSWAIWTLPGASSSRTWLFNAGTGFQFGETFQAYDAPGVPTALPTQSFKGRNGGGDKCPSHYQPTEWELVMFGRFLTVMTFPDWGVSVHTAIAETVMRRVMSSQWRGSKGERQDTIYDVLMDMHPRIDDYYRRVHVHGQTGCHCSGSATQVIIDWADRLSAVAIRNVMSGGTSASMHPTNGKGSYYFFVRVGRYSCLPFGDVTGSFPNRQSKPFPHSSWTDVNILHGSDTEGNPFASIFFYNTAQTRNYRLHGWHDGKHGKPNIVAAVLPNGNIVRSIDGGSGILGRAPQE